MSKTVWRVVLEGGDDRLITAIKMLHKDYWLCWYDEDENMPSVAIITSKVVAYGLESSLSGSASKTR